MKRLLLALSLIFILVACGDEVTKDIEKENVTSQNEEINQVEKSEKSEEEEGEEKEKVELTEQDEKINDIVGLMDYENAFNSGDYAQGDIPKGEYAFLALDDGGNYYSEVDASGDIIANENFSSFGYVKIHEAGDITNDGVLINIDSFDDLEVAGAKELYEIVMDIEDYEDGAWYKVGTDIDPGEYTIESYGSGYAAVMTGPVGNTDIVNNDNFNGEYTVHLEEGQFLNISKATIKK